MPVKETDPPSDDYVMQEPAFRIIRERLKPGLTILDIGCGFGYVGRFLSAAGVRVDGIEPDPVRASVAKEALNRVWACTLEEVSSDHEIGLYDVVTVLDVIEHVISPVEALTRTKQFIAPGGRLFLFVPNSAHWSFRAKVFRGDWSYADWGLFDRTHLRFFDLKTAASLCREAGFIETGRWYTTPSPGFVGNLGQRFRPSLFALHVLFELRAD